MYCAVVLPTLLYGCEAWTPYRRHIRRLDQFHMRCLRPIANIKWQDMIPNTEVLQRCAQTGTEQHIKRAQLRWSGHLVRMADDRIPKDVFYGELDAGHRTRGGQRKRYKDVLKGRLKHAKKWISYESIHILQYIAPILYIRNVTVLF